MRTRRTVAMATLSSSLLVMSLATPSAAARTELEIVNGVPGKRVDVCINGREVASGLRYGRYVVRSTKADRVTVKFTKRDPRRCRGKLLGKRRSAAADSTWVITRRKPQKVVVFDNAVLYEPVPSPTWSEASARHAADLGAVQFATEFHIPDPGPIDPAADSFTKGSKRDHNLVGVDYIWGVFVTRGGFEVTPPHLLWVRGMRRYEWILVGTNFQDARLVFIDRRADPA